MSRTFFLYLKSNILEHIELIQRYACSSGHGGQGIVGNSNRQSCFFSDQDFNILQQGAAAGKNDAPVNNISSKFRRRIFQSVFNRVNNKCYRFVDGLSDFLRIGFRNFGNPGN